MSPSCHNYGDTAFPSSSSPGVRDPSYLSTDLGLGYLTTDLGLDYLTTDTGDVEVRQIYHLLVCAVGIHVNRDGMWATLAVDGRFGHPWS